MGTRSLSRGERYIKKPAVIAKHYRDIAFSTLESEERRKNRNTSKGPRMVFIEAYKETKSYFEAKKIMKEKFPNLNFSEVTLQNWIKEENICINRNEGDER